MVTLPPELLRQDRLQPGDVLLSRAQGGVPKVITLATGGAFSHAALVLNPYSLFEATTKGIGLRPLPALGCGRSGDKLVFLTHPAPEERVDFAVYRHPDLAQLPAEKVQAALDELQNASHGLDYTQLSRLILLTRFKKLSSRVNKIVDKVEFIRRQLPVWRWKIQRFFLKIGVKLFPAWQNHLDFAEKQLKLHRFRALWVPGDFCSELVAKFFQSLDLPLFAKDRSPATVSPADFAQSLLKPVEGAIIARVDLVEWMPPDEDSYSFSRNYEGMNGFMQDQRRSMALWEQTKTRLDAFLDKIKVHPNVFLNNIKQSMESVVQLAKIADVLGDPRHEDRLLEIQEKLYRCALQIIALDEAEKKRPPDPSEAHFAHEKTTYNTITALMGEVNNIRVEVQRAQTLRICALLKLEKARFPHFWQFRKRMELTHKRRDCLKSHRAYATLVRNSRKVFIAALEEND